MNRPSITTTSSTTLSSTPDLTCEGGKGGLTFRSEVEQDAEAVLLLLRVVIYGQALDQ
jgi:hypothetical protein